MLDAIDPAHAVAFFSQHGFGAFVTLGSVFLAITGGAGGDELADAHHPLQDHTPRVEELR